MDPHRPYRSDGVKDNRAPVFHRPEDVVVPDYLIDTEKTRSDISQYYDEIVRMDDHIGQIVTELKRQKKYNNTIIIFISDNGSPFPGAKGSLYDAGIQIPMIIKWNGEIAAGTRYKHLVSTIDIAPTILEMAGMTPPEDFAGGSMLPIFKDQHIVLNEYIFAERNWHGTDEHMRCIRSETLKFIYTGDYNWGPIGIPSDIGVSESFWELNEKHKKKELTPCQKRVFMYPRPKVQIFDLQNDPCEAINLAGTKMYFNLAQPLKNALNKWKDQTRDHDPHERKREDKVDRFTNFPFEGGLQNVVDW